MSKPKKAEKMICDTLLRLMKRKPLYLIKVTDIVAAAGISRSTFYVYFDSVFTVLQKIENDFFEEISNKEALHGAPGDIRALYENMFSSDYMVETFKTLVGPNGDPGFITRFRSIIRNILKIDYLKFKSEKDMALFAEFVVGGMWRTLRYWSINSDDVTIDECVRISDIFIEYINSTFGEDRK